MFSFMANTLGHLLRIFRVLHTVQFSRFFVVVLATARLLYHSSFCLSTAFFKFFVFLFQDFQTHLKRRRRDLNPRAATNDLLPFQGSPFNHLGTSAWLNHIPFGIRYSVLYREPIFLSSVYTVNGESGIRTHAPFRTNGFQDRLVMTTSISLQAFSQTYFCILAHDSPFVKRFI